jgi:solute carrier family 25 2-oxodicarboxylate transporter 21
MDVVRKIIAKEGLLGLYAGMEATFWRYVPFSMQSIGVWFLIPSRHVWWNGGFFGSIYQVRGMLPKAETKQGQMLNNFISGTIGGFIGTAVNTPYVASLSCLSCC